MLHVAFEHWTAMRVRVLHGLIDSPVHPTTTHATVSGILGQISAVQNDLEQFKEIRSSWLFKVAQGMLG